MANLDQLLFERGILLQYLGLTLILCRNLFNNNYYYFYLTICYNQLFITFLLLIFTLLLEPYHIIYPLLASDLERKHC